MGRVYDSLGEQLQRFIAEQPMFFVATAPRADSGHVNLSPKGMDTLRVVDPTTIAYVDLVGSGAETLAHLRENGRITVMWNSFGDKPRILRAYGRGEPVLPDDGRFPELVQLFPAYRAVRSIIRIDVHRVADSCGFGVPQMDLVQQRSRLITWSDHKTGDELEEYKRDNNTVSIDGLPALPADG